MLYNKQNKIQGVTLGLTMALVLAPGAAAAESSPSSLKLAQATATVKQDGQYWINKGHDLRAAGKHEEAIQAYRKAESMGAGSDALTFDIGDTYREMGRDRDAYWEFSKADNSKNHESRMTACEQMQELKYARNKSLEDPYFADLSTSVSWQSIADVTAIDMTARYGKYGEGELPAEYYLYGGFSSDNRSGLVGGFPEEYSDNIVRLGVGVRKPLTDDYSLSFVAEAGGARDLINKNRSRTRDDIRVGFEYYKDWNKGYDCRSTDITPNRFIFSVDSELKYYSLYDDAVFFNLNLKPGIRLLETSKTDLDVFLLLSYSTNLEQSIDSYSEYAVGLTWVPNRQYDFSVTARTGEVFYESGGSDTNFVLSFDHYISW